MQNLGISWNAFKWSSSTEDVMTEDQKVECTIKLTRDDPQQLTKNCAGKSKRDLRFKSFSQNTNFVYCFLHWEVSVTSKILLEKLKNSLMLNIIMVQQNWHFLSKRLQLRHQQQPLNIPGLIILSFATIWNSVRN